ncbi:Beta-adaptin-like protein C [Durusdinium trenchii]|uniref:Beta-adaptin-like protein C n=1 Tax=Durusdinium trenchii TaxID=1381693 RepID=A0ABP0J679_9DINO
MFPSTGKRAGLKEAKESALESLRQSAPSVYRRLQLPPWRLTPTELQHAWEKKVEGSESDSEETSTTRSESSDGTGRGRRRPRCTGGLAERLRELARRERWGEADFETEQRLRSEAVAHFALSLLHFELFRQDQNKMNSTQDPRPGIQTLRETVHTVLVDEAAQAIGYFRDDLGFFEALTENLEIYHFGFILNENFMDCVVKFANQDYIGKHANLEFFNTKSITTSLNFSFLPIHAMTRQFVVTTGSLPSVDVRHRDLISDEIKRSGLIHLSSVVALPDARPELTALKVAMNNYQNFGLCRKRGQERFVLPLPDGTAHVFGAGRVELTPVMSSYAPVPEGTSREAMLILDREIEDWIASLEGDSAEELRAPDNSSERPNKVKVIALTAGVLAALVGVVLFMLSDPCRSPLPLGAVFRGHGIEMVEMKQLEAASRNLKSVKSRTERIAHHKIHKLGMPKGLRKMVGSGATQIGDYFHSEKLAVEARKAEIGDIGWTAQKKAEYWGGGQLERSENFRQAFCVFNVAETIDSLGGTGIDVDAIVRTCPEPRNDISDFACAVNAETLAEMVGTAATWLSSAVSTCDTFPNVGAECASGVAGILGALGEVAASGTLAMTSCKQYPLAGFKADQYSRDAKIDSAGHSTMRISQVANHGPPERRLFMGAGLMGTGVQCGVDIGFIVDNIYDTIFYIQQAVSISSCSKHTRYGPYNYLTGVPEAACAMDISGAIAWITQIATFVQQLISHCPDILELPTLCGSSATGLLSSASQIASWGSQVAIA